jgi:hypothetical protein
VAPEHARELVNRIGCDDRTAEHVRCATAPRRPRQRGCRGSHPLAELLTAVRVGDQGAQRALEAGGVARGHDVVVDAARVGA